MVKTAWRDMRARGVQDDLLREIERVTAAYAPEFQMNPSRWDGVDQAKAAAGTKAYLSERMAWLDSQWL